MNSTGTGTIVKNSQLTGTHDSTHRELVNGGTLAKAPGSRLGREYTASRGRLDSCLTPGEPELLQRAMIVLDDTPLLGQIDSSVLFYRRMPSRLELRASLSPTRSG